MKPLSFYYKSGNPKMQEKGKEWIEKGAVACVILAGGEGSRLEWNGPKGTYPISPGGKSLFELFCERVGHAPLAIMTSPSTQEQTLAFFAEHNYFGLLLEQLSFFEQGQLPLLDLQKNPTEQQAPDGNGLSLQYLQKSGIFHAWKGRGVQYVHILLVDNALADPLDAEMVGVAAEMGHDWLIKCVERARPDEQAGVLVEKRGKIHVIEYGELPQEVGPGYTLMNTGMFCLSMELIERLHFDIPTHPARKKRGEHWYFKQEKFIFDLLPQAVSCGAILYPRKQVFAPLKNKEGENSPGAIRAALIARESQK